MVAQLNPMQVSTPATIHPTRTASSYIMSPDTQTIEERESTYQYRLEQARITLSQAQEHLAALLAESPPHLPASQTLAPSPSLRLSLLILTSSSDSNRESKPFWNATNPKPLPETR